LSNSGNKLVVPVPKKESNFPCSYGGNEIVDYKNLDKFNDNALLDQ
jgi:hypothetical protein